MALTATEDFTGSDGTQVNSLADWDGAASGDQSNGLDIYSNSAAPDHANVSHSNWWTSDSFDNDQYAQGTIVVAGSGMFVGPGVRCSGTDYGSNQNGYHWMGDSGSTSYLEKYQGGSWTAIDNGSGFSASDEVYMEVEGTSIECKINDVSDISATDSSISSGAAGICGYGDGTGTRLDNWEGGNLGEAPSAVPIPVAMRHYRNMRT